MRRPTGGCLASRLSCWTPSATSSLTTRAAWPPSRPRGCAEESPMITGRGSPPLSGDPVEQILDEVLAEAEAEAELSRKPVSTRVRRLCRISGQDPTAMNDHERRYLPGIGLQMLL